MATDPLQERELSDWFNPVLVKDLRRGIRSNVYVVWFVASQTAGSRFIKKSSLSR
jgi:hypothetical protein